MEEYITLAVILVVALLLMKAFRYYLIAGKKCESETSMTDKTVLVTGGNSGIGQATVLELVKRNARVIVACRNIQRGIDAVKIIRKQTSLGEIVIKRVDLASFASIRQFCDEIIKEENHLDVLVNNAGVLGNEKASSEDGIELQMAVNHIGNFLLTNLLLSLLKKSSPSRIVFVSSASAKQTQRLNLDHVHSSGAKLKITRTLFNSFHFYSSSKLASMIFARELHRRLENTGVCVHTVHPGIVYTRITRNLFPSLMDSIFCWSQWLTVKTPEEGCQTVVYCCVAEKLNGVSGEFYINCQKAAWYQQTSDRIIAKKLWKLSEEVTGLA